MGGLRFIRDEDPSGYVPVRTFVSCVVGDDCVDQLWLSSLRRTVSYHAALYLPSSLLGSVRGVVPSVRAYGSFLALSSKVASGELLIPVISGSDSQGNLCFDGKLSGVGSYLTSGEYQFLIAELSASRLVSLSDYSVRLCSVPSVLKRQWYYSDGFVSYIESYVQEVEARHRLRLFMAGYEGFLYGIVSYDASKGSGTLSSLLGHISTSIRLYVDVERCKVIGEETGELRGAEIDIRRRFGGDYNRLRAVAVAYKQAELYLRLDGKHRSPNVEDVLVALDEMFVSESTLVSGRSNARSYMSSLIRRVKRSSVYTVSYDESDTEFLGDSLDDDSSVSSAVLCAALELNGVSDGYVQSPVTMGNLPTVGASGIDDLEYKAKLRSQLLAALATGKGSRFGDVPFSAVMAEAVDLYYFRGLAIDMSAGGYSDVMPYGVISEIDDKLFHIKKNVGAILRSRELTSTQRFSELLRASRIISKLEAIRSSYERDFAVTVPDVAPYWLSTPGMGNFPGSLSDCNVPFTRGVGRLSSLVAYYMARRRVPLSLDVDAVSYAEAVDVLSNVKRYITTRRYFDPHSSGCLPLVRDLYKLSRGYVPICLGIGTESIGGRESYVSMLVQTVDERRCCVVPRRVNIKVISSLYQKPIMTWLKSCDSIAICDGPPTDKDGYNVWKDKVASAFVRRCLESRISDYMASGGASGIIREVLSPSFDPTKVDLAGIRLKVVRNVDSSYDGFVVVENVKKMGRSGVFRSSCPVSFERKMVIEVDAGSRGLKLAGRRLL